MSLKVLQCPSHSLSLSLSTDVRELYIVSRAFAVAVLPTLIVHSLLRRQNASPPLRNAPKRDSNKNPSTIIRMPRETKKTQTLPYEMPQKGNRTNKNQKLFERPERGEKKQPIPYEMPKQGFQ